MMKSPQQPSKVQPIDDEHNNECSRELSLPSPLGLILSEKIHKFAFVVHPLTTGFIKNNPALKFLKNFPDKLVENTASRFVPPLILSKIVGGISPTTGQRIEGLLLSLATTPRVMTSKDPTFTYRKLIQVSRMAERYGAKVLGLGAFTSVVGDAGVTVAKKSPIAVTTGNTLSVVTALETARVALQRMAPAGAAAKLEHVMVVGATGSIGSACSRMLAAQQPGVQLYLVAPKLEKLQVLADHICQESPNALPLILGTTPDAHAGSCQVVVTTTSAFGQRVVRVDTLAPGAIVIDIARPSDVSEEEAALRPDILVIESGEVLIPPGTIDLGYNIGLPQHVAYACLAETALLATEGLFESYSLGRTFKLAEIRGMYDLYKKHQFELAPLRTVSGETVTDTMLSEKRSLAQELRHDKYKLARLRRKAKVSLGSIVLTSKGVTQQGGGLQIITSFCRLCKGENIFHLRKKVSPMLPQNVHKIRYDFSVGFTDGLCFMCSSNEVYI